MIHPAIWAFAYWLIGCGIAYVVFTWKSMNIYDAVALGIFWGPVLVAFVICSPILIPVLALRRLAAWREQKERRLRAVSIIPVGSSEVDKVWKKIRGDLSEGFNFMAEDYERLDDYPPTEFPLRGDT